MVDKDFVVPADSPDFKKADVLADVELADNPGEEEVVKVGFEGL